MGISKNNNRIEFLDTAKGIGIILVVMGHVSTNNAINNWIYSFHMPLFFIISGYIVSKNIKTISIKEFVSRKVKSMLTPYFIFSILTYLYWVIIERNIRGENISIIKPFINIFTAQGGSDNYVFNVVMWFLPCLFVTEIIYYFINKNSNKRIIIMILFLSSVTGYLISQYVSISLPWTLDIMFTSLVFYGIGNLISVNKVRFINIGKRYYTYKIISVFSFLVLTIVSLLNGRVDMNNNIIPNYFMFYISAFSGIIFILVISRKIKLSFINYLGKNSLIIMLVHEPIKRIIIKFIEIITKINIEILRNNIISIIICTLIIITIIIPIIFIIDKYIPFIIGKNNQNKKYRINYLGENQ